MANMRLTLAALLVLALPGCEASNDRMAALPTLSTPSASIPTPSSRPTLSGTVFETTTMGTRPLPGSRVWLVAGNTIDSVMTNERGQYSIANVPTEGRRRIVAFPPAGLQLFQRSAATLPLDGDGTIDIELVSEDTRGARYASPTLSGIVYYVTPDGPRPWPHTRIVYKAFDGPWYNAYQTSDAQGRYEFGRLPLGSGELGAGNCNDQMQFTPVDIRGDTVADIDITRLVTTCPGTPY